MTPAAVRERAATAREYLQVALERLEIAPEGPSAEAQVAAANAVQAAIAACDALSGQAHGLHATGQDHREAVKLVKAIPVSGPRLATKFARLVSDKTAITYGGFCTLAEAGRAVKDASVLIEELDRLAL